MLYLIDWIEKMAYFKGADLSKIMGIGFNPATDTLEKLRDELTAIEGATFDPATDTLEKVRNELTIIEGSGYDFTNDALSKLEPKIVAIPTTVEPQLKLVQVNTTSTAFVDAVNFTGSGIIYEIHGKTNNASDNMEYRITIDGFANPIFLIGLNTEKNVRRFVTNYSDTYLLQGLTSNTAQNLDLRFKDSLLIEYRATNAAGGAVDATVLYGEY